MQEDVHFLIDSAPPKEVEHLLRCLSIQTASSLDELRSRLLNEWSFEAQRNLSFSTRRLCDLCLTTKQQTPLGKPGYVLTALGTKVRSILESDHELYADVMHYLHFDGYDGLPHGRKLFWSYQQCCDIAWSRKMIPPAPEIVVEIQARIAVRFPHAYAKKVGGNFNVGGVTAWKAWIAALASPPFDQSSKKVTPRKRSCFELALLSLDHVYRSRNYRYGDAVIIDDGLLDEAARVFFLDPTCCRELLQLASKVTRVVTLRDTFAGTSVNLLAPYTIESI